MKVYDVELARRDSYVAFYRLLQVLYKETPPEERQNILIMLSVVKTPFEVGREYEELISAMCKKFMDTINSYGFSNLGYFICNDINSDDIIYRQSKLWAKLSLTGGFDDIPCIGCHMYCHLTHARTVSDVLDGSNIKAESVTLVTGERIKHDAGKEKANQTEDMLNIYSKVIEDAYGYDMFPILKNEWNDTRIELDFINICNMLGVTPEDITGATYKCPIGSVFKDKKFSSVPLSADGIDQRIEYFKKQVQSSH